MAAPMLMGSFECLFLQAEAAERGWIIGQAKFFYEQAIQESFKYIEAGTDGFASYNAQPAVDYTKAASKLERIIEQKWLALNTISSIEAWNDFRRLCYPARIPHSLASPDLIQTTARYVSLTGSLKFQLMERRLGNRVPSIHLYRRYSGINKAASISKR